MRLKLFLSFTLIVLVSVSLVALIARRGTVNEVRLFMYRGGMVGLNDLASNLESYYQNNGTWKGGQSIINSTHTGTQGMGGMMNQRLLLADATGAVVLDTRGSNAGSKLSQSERAIAIPLRVDGKTVGYLYASGGVGINTAGQQALLSRLNRGAVMLCPGQRDPQTAAGKENPLIRHPGGMTDPPETALAFVSLG
jgi:hypothetical protein